MKLKEIWKKVQIAVSKAQHAVAGDSPVNSMCAHDVQYIQQKVREQTKFDVTCVSTKRINGRKNVGLVMPTDTSEEDVMNAKNVFIAAAKDKGILLSHDEVLRYVPGKRPYETLRPRLDNNGQIW